MKTNCSRFCGSTPSSFISKLFDGNSEILKYAFQYLKDQTLYLLRISSKIRCQFLNTGKKFHVPDVLANSRDCGKHNFQENYV